MKTTNLYHKHQYWSGIIGAMVLGATFHLAGKSPGNYVAHEWGTFTSVQDAEGTLVEWSPLESSDLPAFVYNWSRPGVNCQPVGILAVPKNRLRTLQRMETPVIYFYSENGQEVDVSVRFPQGLITEWYPRVDRIGPSQVAAGPLVGNARRAGLASNFTFASLLHDGAAARESRADWQRVQILPREPGAELERRLPADASGSHYFSARQTDANYIRMNGAPSAGASDEIEKFIFYRGVGNFATPLRVNVKTDNALTVVNTGNDVLRHLFVLSIRNGKGNYVSLNRLDPGSEFQIQLDSKTGLRTRQALSRELSRDMAESLQTEGLYAPEANAMVQTWRDSWFEEDGVRVLYILPRAWTDRTLPLNLQPSPRELVRVMVGRAEVLLPNTQQQLATQLVKATEGSDQARAAVVESLRELGRFAEPALEVAMRSAKQEVRDEGWNLLRQAR